jgi:hypothetical protein
MPPCVCACAAAPADAHNPLAERRLTKADFVTMNHANSSEEGGMVPVLPTQQLEEIYDRCVGGGGRHCTVHVTCVLSSVSWLKLA